MPPAQPQPTHHEVQLGGADFARRHQPAAAAAPHTASPIAATAAPTAAGAAVQRGVDQRVLLNDDGKDGVGARGLLVGQRAAGGPAGAFTSTHNKAAGSQYQYADDDSYAMDMPYLLPLVCKLQSAHVELAPVLNPNPQPLNPKIIEIPAWPPCRAPAAPAGPPHTPPAPPGRRSR